MAFGRVHFSEVMPACKRLLDGCPKLVSLFCGGEKCIIENNVKCNLENIIEIMFECLECITGIHKQTNWISMFTSKFNEQNRKPQVR